MPSKRKCERCGRYDRGSCNQDLMGSFPIDQVKPAICTLIRKERVFDLQELWKHTHYFWIQEREVWILYNHKLARYQAFLGKDDYYIDLCLKDYFDLTDLEKAETDNWKYNMKLLYLETWACFNQPRYLNCRNGILDFETTQLLPHTQDILTLRVVDRHYIPSQQTIPPLLDELWNAFIENKGTMTYKDKNGFITPYCMPHPHPPKANQPTDREMWKRMLVNLIHGIKADRVLPTLIGLPDAGKSPNIRLIPNMLGDAMCGCVRIHMVGEAGEGKPLLTKEVCYQEEGSMGFASNNTMMMIKTNFSDNPTLIVRLLYCNAQEVPGSVFLVMATNQAFQMSTDYNIEASFKRLMPLFCPNRYLKDTTFEEKLRDPEFLDQAFSYLANQTPVPVVQGWEQKTFQDRNMEIWNWSAYPVLHVAEQIYERCYEVDAEKEENVVEKAIFKEMEWQGLAIPKCFTKKVTLALEQMGIDYRRRKNSGYYVGLRERADYVAKWNIDTLAVEKKTEGFQAEFVEPN